MFLILSAVSGSNWHSLWSAGIAEILPSHIQGSRLPKLRGSTSPTVGVMVPRGAQAMMCTALSTCGSAVLIAGTRSSLSLSVAIAVSISAARAGAIRDPGHSLDMVCEFTERQERLVLGGVF
jgi:hypothetical protein